MAANEPSTLADVRSRLERELQPEVFEHSVRTAELARELAMIHGLDPNRAALAGLLHDVADRYSDEELLARAKRSGMPVSATEARVPKLLHGPVGAEILRDEWRVADQELLDAVRDHVTGGEHMAPLSKVLFLADKLEPGRDRYYGGLEPIRALARTDLDKAVGHLCGWRMTQLVSEGRPVHDRLVATRNRIIENALAEGGLTGWG